MTLDDVIRSGEELVKPEYSLLSVMPIWGMLGIVLLVFIAIWIVKYAIKEDMELLGWTFFLVLLVIVIIFILLSMAKIEKEQTDFKNMIAEWKETTATPFIEDLDVAKRDIYSIGLVATKGIEKAAEGKSYISLTFKHDNHIFVSIIDWFEISMDLPAGSAGYVEYKFLEKDLGHGINEGVKDIKVYLPVDYKFDVIASNN